MKFDTITYHSRVTKYPHLFTTLGKSIKIHNHAKIIFLKLFIVLIPKISRHDFQKTKTCFGIFLIMSMKANTFTLDSFIEKKSNG